MVTLPIVIVAIIAVVGLILLIGGIGLLFWALWMRWYVEPSRRAVQSTGTEGQSEIAAQ